MKNYFEGPKREQHPMQAEIQQIKRSVRELDAFLRSLSEQERVELLGNIGVSFEIFEKCILQVKNLKAVRDLFQNLKNNRIFLEKLRRYKEQEKNEKQKRRILDAVDEASNKGFLRQVAQKGSLHTLSDPLGANIPLRGRLVPRAPGADDIVIDKSKRGDDWED